MSNRETERQRNGETDDTQETEDVPSLATSVKTFQEAVQLSLKEGFNKDCLFIFARALKAFEITHNRRLIPADLQSAFSLWWGTAKSLLPQHADFDEWRSDFEDTFARTHSPLGSNALEEAIRRAATRPIPSQAGRYTSPKLKLLVAVCLQLQLLQGDSPFFLGVRDAAKITKIQNLHQANARLNTLVRDGLLIVVEKGTRKRATRYRFNLSGLTLVETTRPPSQAKASSDNALVQCPPIIRSEPKAADLSASRRSTTYELDERKKALQELIKGFGPEDGLGDEGRKRYELILKKLAIINNILTGRVG